MDDLFINMLPMKNIILRDFNPQGPQLLLRGCGDESELWSTVWQGRRNLEQLLGSVCHELPRAGHPYPMGCLWLKTSQCNWKNT